MAQSEVRENGHSTLDTGDDTHDPHFEPIITLKKVDVKTLEEDEDILFKMRAKLFRLDQSTAVHEWKERGVGDVKLLQHRHSRYIRIVMHREKVLKLCANHLILPEMELVPNCGSDRAWLWNTPSDLSDEEPRPEVLAIRFANSENAQKFKEHFDKAKSTMRDVFKESTVQKNNDIKEPLADDSKAGGETTKQVADGLDRLTLKDDKPHPSSEAVGDTHGHKGDGQQGDTQDKPDTQADHIAQSCDEAEQ